MKPIGGFFESLLPENSFSYHDDALALTNGRACIALILEQQKVGKCYIPNYTCDAVYDPFNIRNIPFELYNIDKNMDPVDLPKLGPDEYYYYINYFGVKNDTVNRLYDIYGDRLIIDNTHDFFKKRQHNCWSFTSARKYFGVPDGAFIYTQKIIKTSIPRFKDISITHNIERLKGNQDLAFKNYQEYEKSLNSEIKAISTYSEKMLSLVDLDHVILKRKENFQTLDGLLRHKNSFTWNTLANDDTPFVYPFLPTKNIKKEILYRNNIFIPTLWSDPLKRENTTESERRIAESLLPLPIDERYNKEDMEFMAKVINNSMKER